MTKNVKLADCKPEQAMMPICIDWFEIVFAFILQVCVYLRATTQVGWCQTCDTFLERTDLMKPMYSQAAHRHNLIPTPAPDPSD